MSDIGAGGKGLPIPANANQLAMAAGPNATERTQAEFQGLPVRAPNTVDEQFPTAALQSSDPRDPMMKTKMELEAAGRANQQASNVAAPLPGATPLGLMVAQDSDFQRLIDIREKELEKQFEQWFAVSILLMFTDKQTLGSEAAIARVVSMALLAPIVLMWQFPDQMICVDTVLVVTQMTRNTVLTSQSIAASLSSDMNPVVY